MSWRRFLSFILHASFTVAQLTSSSLKSHVGSLTLTKEFNPIKEAYWTGYPHHRRTPFAVSPNGSSAYLAYLDASETDVHVQAVDPSTFAAVGDPVTVTGGKEAGGLVAHNDGFALLTNEVVEGEADGEAIPVLYRYTGSEQTFKTFLGGPGTDTDSALASPDINGDLVFSEAAGYYAAYIVVTAYEGSATGHFGDAIRYVSTNGTLETIAGASSSWGCSHNTGIAFEAADAPPFASLCAEDQGAIWLNTDTQGMTNNGVKVSNEHVTNGASNEPMGGMSGSYSALARFVGDFVGEDSYVFAWVSRGAVDLTLNDWMGEGYTTAANRTNNRNVAVAMFSDKETLVGEQATSEVGAADGDSQINWLTTGTADCSNAHAATFDGSRALITWEEIADPICPFDAMGCEGTFAGTSFQMVSSDGSKLGDVVKSEDIYVAGDMVTMSDGRICWPYVTMDWALDGPAQGSSVTKIWFACVDADGSGNSTPSASSSAAGPGAIGATTSSTPQAPRSSQVSDEDDGMVATTTPTSPSGVPEAPSTTIPPSPSEHDEVSFPTATGTSKETSSAPEATRAKKQCPVYTEVETLYVTANPSFV